jgi:assimilatory nitrate reductase catalytic subunit
VCNCFDVAEADIARVRARANGNALAQLQAELKCGTNCGSCLPEVQRLLGSAPARAQPAPGGVSRPA